MRQELSGDPVLLVASHPTRGVDVGAQALIWEQIRQARAAGLAVLLISADLDELIGLSDTIRVMLRGRLVSEADPATVTPQVVSGMCSGDLSVTFAPTSQTVTSGTETAPFSETVNVASGATDGLKNCTIEFLVNGKRVTLPDESPDPAFRQVVTIAVGATKVTVQAQAVSYNANSVADFIYHCPGTPFFPIATAVPHTGGAPTGTPPFNLMFQTQIDSALVPGGICTVSTLVTSRPPVTTNAHTRSPYRSSGTGVTAASSTAGCVTSTSSTSRAEMFSPPRMMTSFKRSTIVSVSPSASARSPVRNQPPGRNASVSRSRCCGGRSRARGRTGLTGP